MYAARKGAAERILGAGLLWAGAFGLTTDVAAQETGGGRDDAVETTSEYWYFDAAPGVQLFVHEVGDGEPVVVLHGGPGADHSYMHGMARGLAGQFNVVFYDQRGSLRSTDSGDVSYTIQDHVSDLEALRRALGAERIHILAHSAGTNLAYHYLAQHPDQVANVVLVGAVLPVNGPAWTEIFDQEEQALFAQRSALFEEFQTRPAVQEARRSAGLGAPTTARDSARLAVLRQYAADHYHVDRWEDHVPLRINPTVAQETQGSIDWNYDRTALLNSRHDRVTVIQGEFDYVVGIRGSPLWQKLVRERMPNVDLIVVQEAGHGVWNDQPVAFATAVACALSC